MERCYIGRASRDRADRTIQVYRKLLLRLWTAWEDKDQQGKSRSSRPFNLRLSLGRTNIDIQTIILLRDARVTHFSLS